VRAVVTGMIAAYPVGGVAWDYGQYLLGLERLGFEVFYLEDSGEPAYDPVRRTYDADASYAVAFLGRSLAGLSPGLERRWHFRGADGRTSGLDAGELAAVVRSADLFLNVSGGCLLRDEYAASRRKVLIDTDPGRNHFVNYPRRTPGAVGRGRAGSAGTTSSSPTPSGSAGRTARSPTSGCPGSRPARRWSRTAGARSRPASGGRR
jgi:hypothetical protein